MISNFATVQKIVYLLLVRAKKAVALLLISPQDELSIIVLLNKQYEGCLSSPSVHSMILFSALLEVLTWISLFSYL